MSEQAKQQQAAPAAAPAAKKGKGFRLSLRAKFAAFTALLIMGVMVLVGAFLYRQQSRTLTREVIERGRTIAEGIISGAREALPINDELSIAVLVKKGAQPEDAPVMEENYDFKNPAHVLAGLSRALASLRDELPGQVARALEARGIKSSLISTVADERPKRKQSIQNEGVFEVILVDKDGTIRGHSDGLSAGKKYQPPRYVQEASESTPFPIYEQEYFDAGGGRHVRLLFDVAQPVKVAGGETELGTVHLGLSQGLVQRVIFDATMKLAAVAVLALVIGLLFAYIFVSVLTAPVGKLVGGVLDIANGNFDTRIKVTTKDELGELTSAFNTMAKSLSENETLKGAFTRFVSDAALKQLLADPSKTGLHSRRALATIYSSDVRGFTAMSETLEPEHVVQVINTYLSLQTDFILKHGGVVDKYIGDATIGIWGKEAESDDDAIRAVRAAVEVQEAIAKMNVEREKKGEVAKQIGIGINTGIVVSGNIGSTKKMEYATAGENNILADKMCDNCPAGKVWLSESTYELVKDQVEVKELPPLTLKGRSEPFPVWEVVRLK